MPGNKRFQLPYTKGMLSGNERKKKRLFAENFPEVEDSEIEIAGETEEAQTLTLSRGSKSRKYTHEAETKPLTSSSKNRSRKMNSQDLEEDEEYEIPTLRRPPPQYKLSSDLTLTENQSQSGYPQFRDRSNPTLHGYSTGYHEMVPTNTMKSLSELLKVYEGKDEFEIDLDKIPGLSGFGKTKVQKAVLDHVLEVGRGLRSDTAQTILSSEKSLAAGHSGSNTSTKGQSIAHNLLREAVGRMVQLNPKTTKGMTNKSVASALCSIAVSAYAPGELAQKVERSSSLKNPRAKPQWESNRNMAKQRANAIYRSLTRDEQDFVDNHAGQYLESTQSTKSSNPRYFELEVPTTPLRHSTPTLESSLGSEKETPIFSGHYREDQSEAAIPDKSLPVNWKDYSYYVTEPFRNERRNVKN